MRAAIGKTLLRSSIALMAALAFVGPAVAQNTGSVSDYRLPDPNQPARPQPQGPIDPDNPWIVRSSPQASEPEAPAPRPAGTPAPRITPSAPAVTPTERPAPRPSPTISLPEEPAPPVRAPSSQIDRTAPAAAITPDPVGPATPPSPEAQIDVPPPAPSPADIEPQAASTDTEEGKTWLFVAALVAALAVSGWLLWRRRGAAPAADEAVTFEGSKANPPLRPEPSAPARTPKPGAVPLQPKALQPSPPSVAAPSAAESLQITLGFEPRALRLSLVYATLQYELRIANAGSEALPPMQVRADLSSAHASIGTRQQLAPAPENLETKHEVPSLASGETTILQGEIRVPLQQIRPLVKGNAQFFVPLARFWMASPDGAAVRRVFTVGPHDPNGTGALASVRLDAGPRNLRELRAREIEAARSLALDPLPAHG